MLGRTLTSLAPGRDARATTASSQNSLWQVLEQSVDAAFVVDARHRVVLFNPAAEALWGCRREDVHGLPFTRLLAAPQTAASPEATLAALTGSHRDATLRRPDASSFHAGASACACIRASTSLDRWPSATSLLRASSAVINHNSLRLLG